MFGSIWSIDQILNNIQLGGGIKKFFPLVEGCFFEEKNTRIRSILLHGVVSWL